MSPKGALLLIAGKGKPDKDDEEEKDDEGSTDEEMEHEALHDAVQAIKDGDDDAAVDALQSAIEMCIARNYKE